jgi:hypothetical protein
MIILYSRKAQLVLLLCWLAGMTYVYARITGEHPFRLHDNEQIAAPAQEARLGQVPELSVPPEPVERSELAEQPVPVHVVQPAPDPELNRGLALRVSLDIGEHTDMLIVELDYIAAYKGGFTIEKARSYYLADAPTFVVALGAPWVSDIENTSFPGIMPQVTRLNLILSESRNLRLLVHTTSMSIARGAKSHITSTDTGIRMEIQLPRQ